jgi:hypothetical protein
MSTPSFTLHSALASSTPISRGLRFSAICCAALTAATADVVCFWMSASESARSMSSEYRPGMERRSRSGSRSSADWWMSVRVCRDPIRDEVRKAGGRGTHDVRDLDLELEVAVLSTPGPGRRSPCSWMCCCGAVWRRCYRTCDGCRLLQDAFGCGWRRRWGRVDFLDQLLALQPLIIRRPFRVANGVQ